MLTGLMGMIIALSLLVTGSVGAQQYPTKVITMVVPFAAGGPTDTVARLIGAPMSKSLGQQVIVENVGGAGGTIAAGRVASASPDGYTILIHHIGMSTAPALYRKLRYKPTEDFAPIGLINEVPMTIVARSNFPANNLKEVIDYVKKNKDKVTYANAGLGAASHLCGMLFMTAIQTDLTTVPYKGTAPAMNDLLGGQVDFMCDQTTNTTSQIKAKKIKVYAVTTKERVASLKEVPTAQEAGLPNFEVSVWHALYAPKGTPKPVVDRLTQALQVALKDKNVIDRFGDLGTSPIEQKRATPEALASHLKAELEKWGPIIKKAGVFAD
ncbi:MAG TPA: tripartite tricarboxylate transporter substrate binding protein BugD [Candidatus Binatia bacterium]|jgi:tripartite-type tricarboxylate transporter receptor subunit TctC